MCIVGILYIASLKSGKRQADIDMYSSEGLVYVTCLSSGRRER